MPWKEAQAEKEKTKTARVPLKELKEKLEEQSRPPATAPSEPSRVNTVKPAAKFKTLSALTYRPEPDEPLSPKNRQYQSYMDDLHLKLMDFQSTLDLRGKRAEETISLLQKYIDDAIMLAIPEVRVLHGKGNGVLRQVTRDYLRSVREIKSAKDEVPERGGSGITVVIFK